MEKSYYIEENPGFLVEKSDFDHLFYVLEKENSEILKKLQHKLKTKINIPNELKLTELYELDTDRTIIKCDTSLNEDNHIINSISNIIKFCELYRYETIAINANFNDLKHYARFKHATQELLKNGHIKVTFFLNKIIELTTDEQIGSILETYHKTLLGGHVGIDRMKNNIRKFYYWPHMTRDIKNYIKKCDTCEKTKVHRHTKPPLQISSTANSPFEKVFMDLVGPINPMGSKGNTYIFTCNCDLTKYAVAIPIKDSTALSTAKAFMHGVILKHGFPKEIVSDNGTNFVSETLKEITKLLRIKKILTTPYHPQANQIERFHRSLANYMKAYVTSDTTYWDIYLDYAVFSYNISHNSSTGFSPFELLYGHPTELPTPISNEK